MVALVVVVEEQNFMFRVFFPMSQSTGSWRYLATEVYARRRHVNATPTLFMPYVFRSSDQISLRCRLMSLLKGFDLFVYVGMFR